MFKTIIVKQISTSKNEKMELPGRTVSLTNSITTNHSYTDETIIRIYIV